MMTMTYKREECEPTGTVTFAFGHKIVTYLPMWNRIRTILVYIYASTLRALLATKFGTRCEQKTRSEPNPQTDASFHRDPFASQPRPAEPPTYTPSPFLRLRLIILAPSSQPQRRGGGPALRSATKPVSFLIPSSPPFLSATEFCQVSSVSSFSETSIHCIVASSAKQTVFVIQFGFIRLSSL